VTGPLDSTAPHESPSRSLLFTSDWRAGHRFALFWLALGLCLLSLAAAAMALFGWGITLNVSNGFFAIATALLAALIFAVASLLFWAGLRTRYVLTFTAVSLIALAAVIVWGLLGRTW
jgi:hypothetical protein